MYKYPGSALNLVGSDLERALPSWLEPSADSVAYDSSAALNVSREVDFFELRASVAVDQIGKTTLLDWLAIGSRNNKLYTEELESYSAVVEVTDTHVEQKFLDLRRNGILAEIHRRGGENTSRILVAAGTVACMNGIVGWRNRQARYPDRLQRAKQCLDGAWELAPSLQENETSTRIKELLLGAIDHLRSPEEVYRDAASEASVENARSAAAELIFLVCPPTPRQPEVVADLFGAKILAFHRPNKTGR